MSGSLWIVEETLNTFRHLAVTSCLITGNSSSFESSLDQEKFLQKVLAISCSIAPLLGDPAHSIVLEISVAHRDVIESIEFLVSPNRKIRV